MVVWFKRAAVVGLIALVVVAHVGLWSSSEIPQAIKLRLTILNGLGWLVIGGGALAVSLWARSHGKDRN